MVCVHKNCILHQLHAFVLNVILSAPLLEFVAFMASQMMSQDLMDILL